MNQKLQQLLDSIQEAAHLSDDEKNALVKTVRDADKEFEIVNFKLDRTEKVKRTTAILLEETIDELELKRKAVEAQNRELEVESALERVRTAAMGMRKPDDMLDVCRIISEQLELLKVKDIRNVQTAIIYENKGTYINYEYYGKHDKLLITEVDFRNHPLQEKFANQMLKGAEELFSESITGKELSEWYAYQKTTNQFADSYLETASSLNYYWYSLGPVALGMSTYTPLNENEILLFKRFRNVFELAYRRFLDIEKAIAQAKESQVETSLERVRAQAMSMRTPEELTGICEVLYAELHSLGFKEIRNAMINIHDDEKGTFVNYDYSDEIGKSINHLVYNIHPVIEKQIKQMRSAGDAFSETHFKGKDLEDWKAFRKEIGEKDDPRIEKADALYYYFYSIGTGSIGISTFSVIAEEKLNVLKRFRNVFNLSYQRYTDIAQAEAQAREAKIEAALERVRSRSMGMQKSEELKEVIKIVYQQLTHLKINLDHAGFVVDYTPGGDWHFWIADEQDIPSKITHPYFESIWANQFNKAKEKATGFFATNLNFEEKNKFYNELLSYVPGLPQASKDFYLNCPGLGASTVLFENVSLYIENFSGTPYTDEENAMLMRFGKVFQQTYTRFLDLQKAEVQVREAKIEAALERTRTQSMIMQHSNELDDSLRVFHEQVLLLGIPSAFSFLWLPDEKNDRHIFWAAWKENKNDTTAFKSKAINYPLDRNEPATAQCLIDWKGNEPIVSYHVPPSGVKNYFAAWQELIDGVEQLKPEYFSGGLYYVEAFMKYGCFGVIVTTDLTKEEKKILGRFAIEFERTYRRFLDLQKAEAQAREAQIEAALEKVRSRTMAMQRSDELSGTAALLFQEFKKSEQQELIQITIGIYNEAKNEIEFRATDWEGRGEQIDRPAYGSMEESTLLKPAVTAWRANAKSLIVDLTGKALDEWVSYRNKMTGTTISSTDAGGRRVVSIAFFSKGHLSLSSPLPLHAETVKTLERFAAVFDGTYTRFLDLKKAEAQARESHIEAALERVRSRTLAMQKSDELAETAAVLFKQLINLGIAPNRLFIGIIRDESGDIEAWATNEDGSKVETRFMLNAEKNESVKKMYEGWKAQKKSLSIDMQGKELENYFHYLGDEIHVPFKGGLEQKRRVQNIAYFGKGFIGMASPDEQPEETITLLERFAAVFNLTYTRFNDLKVAEAHAIQAEEDLIKLQTEKKRAEDALTELRATQNQLIQSEKMASLGELTAGIAHEIQNPLNFVNNFSEVSNELLDEMNEEILKGNYEEVKAIADDVKQNLEKINHHGKRADAIVKGMLQHSRSSTATKESTDINKLADEYLRLAYHGLRAKDKSFNAALKTDFDESIGNINIIPQDMGRVILNLITNAFYVVQQKQKEVAVSGKEMTSLYEPTVSVSTKKLTTKVEISVKDNGSGIPPKVLDKIFQPFFTTKPTGQGTGLGLSLSYDIVKAHGGELKVETKEGDGTTFIISLPG